MNIPSRLTRNAGLAFGLVALAAVSACSSATGQNAAAVRDDGTVDLSKVTLTVGDQKGGSKALLQASGALDELPYDVEWKEFTSGPPLLEALNAGAIDIGGVGNTPPLFAAAAGSDLVAVSGDTMGARGDTIVVPKDSEIDDVADLQGKDIAVAKGSSANYNLLAQLEEAGVGFDDVNVQYLQPADALAAFSAGHVDAWAIWDPYTAQAELEEDARVLVDGSGLVNGMTFQAADPDALADKATAAAIEDYVTRLAAAKVWSNTHRDEWAKVWSDETGLAVDVTSRAVNRRVATPVALDEEVIKSEQAMADAFVEAGLLPEQFDVEPFFDDRYNDAIRRATETDKE
ncbi:MAG TPA: ABC transporter substrate-binding protein [Nocardioidaceae bacterium]|nr:ABC transporter substrate-binding protein [Nocardioidaceae bacterium]